MSATYLTVNKLCDKLEEFITSHKNKDVSIDSAYEFYIILHKDYIFPDKFNADRVVCRPLVVSIYKHHQLLYKDLCQLFDCEKVYLCLNKKGKNHQIDSKNKIQNIVIERVPKKFITKDGKEISFHQLHQFDTGFLLDEINERIKQDYGRFVKECGL